jgi:hypothetical protein
VLGEIGGNLVAAACDVSDMAPRQPKAQAHGERERCEKYGGESLHLAEI